MKSKATSKTSGKKLRVGFWKDYIIDVSSKINQKNKKVINYQFQ